jgi:hypothetical protein
LTAAAGAYYWSAMGLAVHDAAMLAELASALPRRRTVICLGLPKVTFRVSDLRRWSRRVGGHWEGRGLADEARLDARGFFRSLGFERCLALDISDYEGAEILHDLNRADPPAQHCGIADLVFDSGTLEHVFHVPNALSALHELLDVGGLAVHSTPCNGYLDHGFYQLCPTLLYDYYRANQYRIVSANVVNSAPSVRSDPYLADVYREHGPRYVQERYPRALVFFAAAKTAASTRGVIPMQSYYRQMHDGKKQVYDNERPFAFAAPPRKLTARVRAMARRLGKRFGKAASL